MSDPVKTASIPEQVRPNVLICLATDDPRVIDAADIAMHRAEIAASLLRVEATHRPPKRETGSGAAAGSGVSTVLAMLHALAGRQDAIPDSDDGFVVFIGFDCAALDLAAQYQYRRIALSMLETDGLQAAQAAFRDLPMLGVAAPLGTPRIPLKGNTDNVFHSRLASQLGLSDELIKDGLYFPVPMYFARAQWIRRLLARYLPHDRRPDPQLENALALGFHCTCIAMGYAAHDLIPKARPSSCESIRKHIAQLSLPGSEGRRASEYRAASKRDDLPATHALKYIAYYLPQFHAIPENDLWWGKGFTEWTNVTRAVPRFVGHDQPHLPTDLGFYDLTRDEVLDEQIDLARAYGIHGFCFYFYWFNGKTLLEHPVRRYLEGSDRDFPFCLCWANENWTRRWDGQEQEILIEQAHSARDDLRFIEHIAAYLRDPRYIRIGGKPLLLVYRGSLLADARATAQRWRKWCRDNGIGEIYLAAVLSFEIDDPRPFGFDAAVEFPPHQLRNLPPINSEVELLDPAFAGEILDYRETVLMTALDKFSDSAPRPFPLLHGVMTGWDNDPRRQGKGRVFHHAHPSGYADWLRLASTATLRRNPPELQYVFINAWNEWAEGAHLEPDRRFGHAYLAATADVLRMSSRSSCSPPDLGTSTGALAHLPAHLLPRLDRTRAALAHAMIAGRAPELQLRVVLTLDQGPSAALIGTLTSIAEQSFRRFALTIVTRTALPFTSWFDHPEIPLEQFVTDDPSTYLTSVAMQHPENWLVLVWAGDRLFPDSLLTLAAAIMSRPNAEILLADELQHRGDPAASRPCFGATPNIAGLRARGLDCAVLAVRAQCVHALGGLDGTLRGASESDLTLRCAERYGMAGVVHIPETLAWRDLHGHPDLALPGGLRAESLRRALSGHIQRLGLKAEIQTANGEGISHVVPIRTHAPLVSILIPTHDQVATFRRCVESVFGNTQYPNYELVVIDHANTDPEARAFLDGLALLEPNKIRVVPFSGAFNYAALNNHAVKHARGTLILFMNDDVAALHPEWLDALVDEASMPDVAIVGPRLVFPDGRLQHAGVVLGMSGFADFPFQGAALDAPGPADCLLHVRDVSALSGACLLVRRDVLEMLSGMDESLDLAYADFDLCIRATQAGHRVVWTPRATLMHEVGLTLRQQATDPAVAAAMQRAFEHCQTQFFVRHRRLLARDPHINPRLSLTSRGLRPELNPALTPDLHGLPKLPCLLALPADDSGSGEYRVGLPAREAQAHGLTRSRIAMGYPLQVLIEKLEIETLHTQRQVDDAQLRALRSLRTLMPLRIVMDFDDALEHVPPASAHKASVWPDIGVRLAEACRLSDTITVTTEPLAHEMRRLHGDVRVIPNAIDPGAWAGLRVPDHSDGKRLRVGWAGGISHAEDLAILREVVRTLADEVDWVFLGMCLEDMRPHLTEFHRGVPLAQYPARLADLRLDLALAPLAMNHFNECKSNLRLLEYGALGIPVLASDSVPYQCDLPVTRLRNEPARWIATIRERIGEHVQLRAEGRQLRERVLQDWTIASQLPKWRQAWTEPRV